MVSQQTFGPPGRGAIPGYTPSLRWHRSIAPKTRKIAVQLRDSQGCLQDASTQAEQLHRHYQRVYTTPEPHTLPSPPARIHMQVEIEEVYQALLRLPVHKATPAGKASTSIWRSCADILAPLLAQYTCAAHQVPQLWRDAWLTLVPKIPRPLEPKNLRPIGLTEAGGRAMARILQERLRPHINRYLHSIPQFAYLAKRSTSHAILRVQSHCRQVQDLCSTPARKIMDAFEAKPKHCCNQGGLQLSLDLTSAFDVLSWQLISLSMKAAKLPEALQNWVSSWYTEVRYFVKHLGWEKCVHASQGVRQGCLLAPLLWSLCAGYLLVSLQQVVSPEWVAQSITGYADDFHASDRVKSYQDLENAEYRFGSLLDVLADANMCINQKKSAILLRVRGSFAQRWLRHHQLKRDTGPHLRIRTPKGRQYEFPLKEHHVYLGVKISYYSSAKHTVAHRIQAANHAWQRLRRILCSRTQLDVWKTTCNLESHSDTHSDVWTGRVGTRPQRHLSNAASTYQAGSRDHSPLCASQQGFYPGTTPPFSPVYSSRHVAQGSACTASSAPDQ